MGEPKDDLSELPGRLESGERWRVLTATVSLLLVAGCGFDPQTAPPRIQQRLEASLAAVVAELELPGATLAVTVPNDELWLGAAGSASLATGEAMQPTHRFRIGSVTKTFTAAVVLQLIEEQELALDDSLEQHYPGFPFGADITIEHLLRHTSDIYDPIGHGDIAGQQDRDWAPEEFVAMAAAVAEKDGLSPGLTYEYSNTNYILLGLIIESVTGHTWASEVRRRLLDPIGLDDTFVESDEPVPGHMARGHLGSADFTDEISPTIGWAAGSIVSNGPDLVTWLEALFGGRVLAPSSLAWMKTPTFVPDGRVYGYGLGLDIKDSPLGANTVFGHSGDSVIYRADAFFNEGADVVVIGLHNSSLYYAEQITAPAWTIVLDELAGRAQLR